MKVFEVQVLVEFDGDHWQGTGYWSPGGGRQPADLQAWIGDMVNAFDKALEANVAKGKTHLPVRLLALSAETIQLKGMESLRYACELAEKPGGDPARVAWEKCSIAEEGPFWLEGTHGQG